jgi:hypothetical protein
LAALTLDEIVARVLQQEAMRNPRVRDLRFVVGASAVAYAFLLLASFFSLALPLALEDIAVLGPPYMVMLSVGVGVEGLVATSVLLHRNEEAHALLGQKVSAGVGAIGAGVIGLGAVVFVVWQGLLVRYSPDTLVVAQAALAIVLSGAAVLVAALPALATSLIRATVEEDGD